MPTRLAGLAAVVLVFGSAACGGFGSAARSDSIPNAKPPLDCRGETEIVAHGSPSPSAGVSYVTMTVDGKLRDYRLFIPPTLPKSTPVPLVIVLHGSPIDAAGFEDFIHFDSEATKAGFIAASPNGCFGFWSYAERGSKVADDDFIERVITTLEAKLPIDKARVFIVGASAGSWVEYRLACDASNLIAAIASIAGTMRLSDECKPARSVSILEMHGTDDQAHPWQGGGDHLAFPVEAVIERWTSLDGCTGKPVVSQSGITITSSWTQCREGAVVRLDKVVGGRHTWFGSSLDPVPGEPDANTTIWSFFSSLPPRS